MCLVYLVYEICGLVNLYFNMKIDYLVFGKKFINTIIKNINALP